MTSLARVGDDARFAEPFAAVAGGRWRHPSSMGIKVNLYRGFEVAALAAATAEPGVEGCPLECVMVGDSYFMTHLGRASTALATAEEQAWGMDVLESLVAEVRGELDQSFPTPARPCLLADLPNGAAATVERAVVAGGRMVEAGADAVKIELADEAALAAVEALSDRGIPVVAHLGYTPQSDALARHGDSLASAFALFALARRARDAGASAIVLEMVSEAVNRALSAAAGGRPGTLPTYSIFSGRAPYGAQSLNVWDAVFRPVKTGRSFPPTARHDASTERHLYTEPRIASALSRLLRMTLAGEFPPSPRSRLGPDDLDVLRRTDPWVDAGEPPPGRGPVRRGDAPTPVAAHRAGHEVFDDFESAVRTYSRRFPAVFTRARHHLVRDEDGREYVDFLCGAGALNYGHNHPAVIGPVLEYLRDGGIVHGMDLHTAAKRDFIRSIVEVVLQPRGLRYRLQFTGPTGTNAVEAALKVARRATGRTGIVAFTNGFHGMTLGALAATGSAFKRGGAGVPLVHVSRLPYDGYLGDSVDTLDLVVAMLDDPGSGLDRPAAFIVEAVQGEGGVHVAGEGWLRRLEEVARERGILLILDEVQTGCGRTGPFFGFEHAGLVPDLVCLSKSLGGAGLPIGLLLVRPDLDGQAPGEHSGTFRGNNLAFVAGAAALGLWRDPAFVDGIAVRSAHLGARLDALAAREGAAGCSARGRGMLRGLAWADKGRAGRVSQALFAAGMLAETCGPHGEVLKLMPPLTIDVGALEAGLDLLERVVGSTP